jgi:hypothetical protein
MVLRPFAKIYRALRGFVWLFGVSLFSGLRGAGVRVPACWFPLRALERKAARQLEKSDPSQSLLVVCDFAGFSLSYDVIGLLVLADDARRRGGLARMDVAFVADADDPLMDDRHASVDYGDRRYLTYLHNLAIDATRLIESVGDVHVFSRRAAFEPLWRQYAADGKVFPPTYTPYRPDYMTKELAGSLYGTARLFSDGIEDGARHVLSPGPVELDLARAWLKQHVGSGFAITVTLREAPYETQRNSNVSQWQKLIDAYAEEDITFIVLRDYFTIFEPPVLTGTNVVTCSEAVLNMPFRAALYQCVDLNLFSASGPASLCFLNAKTRYIIFLLSNTGTASDVERIKWYHGVGPGDNLKGASPFQELVWEEDRFDVMHEALGRMIAKIAGAAGDTP